MKEIGFPIGTDDRVPTVGDTGVSSQFFCPLINGQCVKQRCMFWVELYMGDLSKEKVRGHCAYFWNAIQLCDIKGQLIKLNEKLEKMNASTNTTT